MERTFSMPDLGEGLDEGRIVEWLVAEGDEIALNQPLVEVDTAKATVEIPSPFAGRVTALHGTVDATVPVGDPLVTFDVDADPRPVKTTPPVRRLAKELGVDLLTLRGSGPEGRVSEVDVRRVADRTAAMPEGTVAVTVSHAELRPRRIEVGAIRASIAETLSEQARIPQVTTFRAVDCTALEGLRAELAMSPLPVLLAALCEIVPAHPLLNAGWKETHIVTFGRVNVGIAVDTERGLVVPVLRAADERSISELNSEIRRLAEGARSGSLSIDDHVGPATIAVSNTGSYGSESGTPLLSPGTSVTLAFGGIQPRALVVGEQVVARPAATISCTFDHRVLDGAAAGRALTDLVALLESRERLEGLPR